MEEVITKIFRVRKTVYQMLRDRGYLISDKDLDFTKESLREQFGDDPRREDLTILSHKANSPGESIYVFFPSEPKPGVKEIRLYVEKMKSHDVHRAIIVMQLSPSSFAKATIAQLAPKFLLELFQEDELMVNIINHVLVPLHEILSEEEKKRLLERYTVKETQLPRMQLGDPVARYYGLKRGQVVRIIRPSETAGRYITYRYVF